MDRVKYNFPLPEDLLLNEVSMPRGFPGLLSRIQTLYGMDITLREFLEISEDEFATRQGIGCLYVKRLLRLQKHFLQEGVVAKAKSIASDVDIEGFDIPINNVPAEYSHLYASLRNICEVQTYADILNIDLEQFRGMYGVGLKKYQRLLRWRTQILKHPPKHQPRKVEPEDLNGYRLNFSCLTKSERTLINRFLRRGMSVNEITPSFLMEQSPMKLISVQGVGRQSATALSSIQQKIRGFFARTPESRRFLISDAYGQNSDLCEIGQCLLEDLESFVSTLSGQEKDIFIRRSGFGEEQLTLEELGDQFGVTRERIRQKEQGLFFDLLHSVRILSEVLASKIDGLPVSSVMSEMAGFRQSFSTDSACLRMLAYLAGIDARKVLKKAAPAIPQNALDDFFCFAQPPVAKNEVLAFLQEELDLDAEVAEEALTALEKQDLLAFEDQTVAPKSAKKEVAVCHLLAMHPDGLDWSEIAQKVNDLGLCRTQLSLKRADGVLHSSAYIFQSGRRQFSHLRYLGLSKERIRYWLADIKTALQQSEHKALHLRAEYYAQLTDPKPDYYRIRHVARDFGAQAGIYFNGQSQVDTVSLDPDSKCVSQLEALARILAERPMAIEEVARHIHSQTEGHARAYLETLISEGRVVRMDDDRFASPTIAFADIDTEKVLETVRSMLQGDGRIHHMSVFTTQVNRATGLDLTPKSCRALIKAYAKQEQWHVSGCLVASRPFEWTGLSEVVREASDVHGEDLISWVQQRVCASREVIKRAIYNSGAKLAESGEDSFSDGLASDLMQELFEL